MGPMTILSEEETMQRFAALTRVRCDVTDRSEFLDFIAAIRTRTVMTRPFWIVFEVLGTPQEVEGIYQATRPYGMIDLVSAASTFLLSVDTSGLSEAFSEAVASLP